MSLELVSKPSYSNPLLHNLNHWSYKESSCCYHLGTEPTSVLDTIGSPSPPTSTSTLSSSFAGGGGGGSTDSGGEPVVSENPSQKWPPAQPQNAGVDSGGGATTTAVAAAWGAEKYGVGMEEWESEQSILRWIMGDVEDPSMGLNKLLQTGAPATAPEFELNSGFGAVDQGFGLDPVGGNLMGIINPSLPISGFPHNPNNNNKFNQENLSNPPNPMFSPSPTAFNQQQECQQSLEYTDLKQQILNPQLLINHHQAQPTQNPSFFLPFPYPQQEQLLISPPQAKRHNPGGLGPNLSVPKGRFFDLMLQQQPQVHPHYAQRMPTMEMKPKMVGDEMGNQHQRAIIDQLYKSAELVQTGNSVLAQQILARLNHQLSPIGKPFHRAAFFCKEALQLLLHTNNSMNTAVTSSPFNLILKIGAYKSFSEMSPLIQFANFTCNQALLEVLEGFDRIHIVDFEIGYGGQWASLMQELALRSGGAPSLKITVVACPSTHDQLELGLTRDSLIHFAGEISMAFEFEILSLDSLISASLSLPLHVSEDEAVAVNLPTGSFSNSQLPLPIILRFVTQLSPKIVVSVDRGCDRTDLPFPNHVIHALQSYSNLLESLDAVNVNPDALLKIERFLLQPGIEKIILGCYRSPEKTLHWRSLFLSSGLSPLTFSNFTESQAECVVKRTPVRGFHVEKRQSSLVLCWQRKELISASAWRC